MSGQTTKSLSQRELLEHQLLRNLGRPIEGASKLLVFEGSLGALLEAQRHPATIVAPGGPWPRKETFDLVIGLDFLERVEDDRVALAGILDLLDHDGVLLLALPKAITGREPPASTLRSYGSEEFLSLLMRSGLEISQAFADGPELIICECRRSTEAGAEMLATVAAAVGDRRWDDAEATLAAIVEQLESEALVREYAMLIGHVHLGRGRLEQALEAFSEASHLGDAPALPLTAMGAVALAASDLEAATDLFRAALDITPTQIGALRGMAVVHEAQGDLEAAVTAFDMAATQSPGDRELAEKVVTLGADIGWGSAARHAISRHVRATGNERWATAFVNRLIADAPTELVLPPRTMTVASGAP